MHIEEIKKICFVGAGTMGCVNALVSAVAGYDCVVYDPSESALASAPQRLVETAPLYAAAGLIDPAGMSDAMSRIRFVSDPAEAAAAADLLSESVPENRDLKRQVHQQFDELCPSHTLMTTNTSVLLVSDLEDAIPRTRQFAALHFNPGSRLVDVAGGAGTTVATLEILCRFAESLALTPLKMAKEKRGYLFNSLFGALHESAMLLHKEWGQAVDVVDSAWMIGQGAMVGPFGALDFVGLDIVFDGSRMNGEFVDDKKDMARIYQDVLRPYIERGELGIKSGRGFYPYPEAAYFQPGFLDNRDRAREFYEIMLGNVIAQAVLLVLDGYASFEHVDRAWMIAQQQDRGPFGVLDSMGIDTYVDILGKDLLMTHYLKQNAGRIIDLLQAFLQRGELGHKTGCGFYTYPDPLYAREGFLEGNS